jgi:ATP-dependent Zn protease
MQRIPSPYGRPVIGRPRWLPPILVVLGLLILTLFVVDKVIVGGPGAAPATLSNVMAHLEKHEVRRVTVPARTMLVELNDGSKVTVDVPSDRDLGPLVRRSGADLAFTNVSTETPLIGYVFQFVPFLVMAVLLLFVLQITTRRQPR